jgi:hypothetical protein
MMVGIDDRQIGREDRLLATIEPVLADGKIIRCWGGRGRHGGLLQAASQARVA